MNYLLDTHTLIWAVSEKERLSRRVTQTLADPNNTFFVSAITLWEIALKFSNGKLTIEGIMPDELPALSLKTGFKLIPLSQDEGATYHQLFKVSGHKDPFDRMLIWQAIQRNLIFITKDDDLGPYKIAGLKTFW